jgi:hypothetical protein
MWWRRVRERIWPRRAEARAERVLTEAVDGLSDVADYLRYDPVPPVWRELRKYSWDKLRADAFAAAMVATALREPPGVTVIESRDISAAVSQAPASSSSRAGP